MVLHMGLSGIIMFLSCMIWIANISMAFFSIEDLPSSIKMGTTKKTWFNHVSASKSGGKHGNLMTIYGYLMINHV